MGKSRKRITVERENVVTKKNDVTKEKHKTKSKETILLFKHFDADVHEFV